MSLQNLNPSFILSEEKAIQKHERQLIQSFIPFYKQLKSDKELLENARKNVLAILNKSKFSQYYIVVDKLAHKISVTDNKRKTVDYKKVLETLRVEYNLSQASIDELVNAHTSVTEYQQLNIGETNAK
jgi:hypothetical protein|tara:strand:- start:109 stop:492 length:384 start_codon:yes stop_codon:yes gene_type:complete